MSVELSFVDLEFIADPYPGLAKLRQHGKPVWSDELGVFLAASHKGANQVLRTRTLGRIFQPKHPEDQWNAFHCLHANSILDSKPPKHTRLRSLVTKAFNPKRIDSLRPTVATIVDSLLNDLEEVFSRRNADLIGSANRDETVFDNRNTMDLTRDPKPHTGFGAGIHFCIGAPLARMEMSAALPKLMERFADLDLAGHPTSRETFVLRGWANVPITAGCV